MKPDDATALPVADLVEAARNGDRAAFDRLLEIQLPRLWRVAWRIIQRGPECEQVVHDAGLAAHRALPAYSGETPFDCWLLRIVTARALKLLERSGEVAPGAPPRPAAGPVALTALEPPDLSRRLAAARAHVAGPLRAAFVLRDAETLEWDDVESILGAAGAARARVARARNVLRRLALGLLDSSTDEQRLADLVSGFLDGELTPAERSASEARLATDESARVLLEDFRRLREVAGADETPAPPEELLSQILAELPAGEPTPRRRRASAEEAPTRSGFSAWKTLAGVILLVALAAVGSVGLERGWWSELLAKLKGSRAERIVIPPPGPAVGAGALDAESSPAPIPDTSADAPSESSVPLESAASPAPGGESAASGEEAAPEETLTAPAEQSAAESAQATAATPGGAPPHEQAPAPQEAAPAATPTPGVCARTWRIADGRALAWSGPTPLDSARRLGGLAQQLGGRGVLVDGQPVMVRITAPATAFADLVAGLAREGVVAPSAGPPAGADCVSVLVVAVRPGP